MPDVQAKCIECLGSAKIQPLRNARIPWEFRAFCMGFHLPALCTQRHLIRP